MKVNGLGSVGSFAALTSMLVASPGLAAPAARARPTGFGAEPLAFHLRHYFPPGGDHIGIRGLVAADLDGAGSDEIVYADLSAFDINSIWRAVAFDGTRYQTVGAFLPPDEETITALQVARLEAGSAPAILVARGTELWIHDGVTHELETVVPVPTGEETLFAVDAGDVDADGTVEIVVSDYEDLWVFSAATHVLERQLLGLGGFDLRVGQVDFDAALEIVVAKDGGMPGFIVDGVTGQDQWNGTPLGRLVGLADLDANGRLEVAGADPCCPAGIDVYDIVTEELLYHVDSGEVAGIAFGQLDPEGPLALVYADDDDNLVHVVDAETGIEDWFVEGFKSGFGRLAVGNTDGDPAGEILFGNGANDSGSDHFSVVDGVTQAEEWRSTDFSTPIDGFDLGDLDLDGETEFVYLVSNATTGGPTGAQFFVHDAATGLLERTGPVAGLLYEGGASRLRVADVDADPQPEVFVEALVLASNEYALLAFDGVTLAEEWRAQLSATTRFVSLEIGEVDGDPGLEIVAGTHNLTGGTVNLRVHDAGSGQLEWLSPALGIGSLAHLRIAEVDRDPNPEIVVARERFSQQPATLYLLSADTREIDFSTQQHPLTALDTPDLEGDGVAEVIVGTEQGELRRVDLVGGGTAEVLVDFDDFAFILGLAFHDFNADGQPDPAFVHLSEAILYDLATGSALATWPLPGGNAGLNDTLRLLDFPGDEVPDVALGGYNLGVVGLSVTPPVDVFADGFESGDTSAWDATVP